jgi:hypothetical protein
MPEDWVKAGAEEEEKADNDIMSVKRRYQKNCKQNKLRMKCDHILSLTLASAADACVPAGTSQQLQQRCKCLFSKLSSL